MNVFVEIHSDLTDWLQTVIKHVVEIQVKYAVVFGRILFTQPNPIVLQI